MSTTSTVTKPRTRVRWMIIWLAFIGISINYLDSSSLAVPLPFMGEDLKLLHYCRLVVVGRATGSFGAGLLIIGGVALVGTLNYLIVIGKIEPLAVPAAVLEGNTR